MNMKVENFLLFSNIVGEWGSECVETLIACLFEPHPPWDLQHMEFSFHFPPSFRICAILYLGYMILCFWTFHSCVHQANKRILNDNANNGMSILAMKVSSGLGACDDVASILSSLSKSIALAVFSSKDSIFDFV